MYICILYACIHVHVYMYVYVSMCVCVYISYRCIYAHVYMLYIHPNTCIHTYIFVYIRRSICLSVYTHKHLNKSKKRLKSTKLSPSFYLYTHRIVGAFMNIRCIHEY